MSGFERLTPRELDVLRLALQGHTDAEIGQALGIAVNTVKVHLRGARDQVFCESPRTPRWLTLVAYELGRHERHAQQKAGAV